MNKRTFLKLSASLLATPALAQPIRWANDDKLRNWAGNLTYSTTRLQTAKTLPNVQAAVRKNPNLKVLGTRHCFNTIADSQHQFLSVLPMDEVIAVDETAKTVTVGAGIKYGQLAPYLHQKGFALHNLASLPHISVAGACATATHGSGVGSGNLSTAVAALEFVSANGDVHRLDRRTDGETFRGAVVNLGALGVLTRLTLDVQPTYQVKQYVYENLPFEALRSHFHDIEASGYSVSLFTDWQHKRISEVWIKQRTDHTYSPLSGDFYGAKAATKNLHPIAELSAVNCTEQLGVAGPWYERLPHFKMGFTPSSGKELQSEYFVPIAQAVEAIMAVEKLNSHISPHLFITELRTIAADELWMSPCYKQASLAIHFTWKPEWEAVRKVLPMIERALAPFGVRPHWGKLFTIPPATLQARYAKLADFKKLVQQYDPKGKFRNDFLATNLYGK